MGQDPGPRGRWRLDRDEPVGLREGGRRSDPVARLPEVPALSLEQAGRPSRVGGIDPGDGAPAEFDRRPVLADEDGGLRRAHEDLHGSTWTAPRRRDAFPQLDRAQVSTMGVEVCVARLGDAGGLGHRGQGACVVARGIPVIGQLGRRRRRPRVVRPAARSATLASSAAA